MRWVDALKEWNKGSGKWCIPKKGTVEYDAVKAIMGDKKSKPAPAPKMKKPAVAIKEKESPEMKNAKIRYFESIGKLADGDKFIASMSPEMKKDYDKYLKKPTKPKPLASYARYS